MRKEFDERFVQGKDKCDLLIVDDEPNFRPGLEGYFKQKMPGIKTKLAEDERSQVNRVNQEKHGHQKY